MDHNSKFSLGPHKIISTPNQLEVAWNIKPTFPNKMDYEYFPLFLFKFFIFFKEGEVV